MLLTTSALVVAQGDAIEPSDRFVNFVNVREKPSTSSALLGQLAPRERVVLLLDVPSWYKVRLEDGTEGFVSKAWTRRVAAEPPAPPSVAGADIPIHRPLP